MKQEKRYSGSIIPDRFLYFKELFKQDEIHKMYTILVNIYLLAANYIFKSFIQCIDEVSMYTV